MTEPVLKWVGGKRRLLSTLTGLLPVMRLPSNGSYFEPFLGGGAMFFRNMPLHAVLSDSNEELIRTYRGIRDNYKEVADVFEFYARTRWDSAAYANLRCLAPGVMTDTHVAARMLYLNQTGFNGLYRVNAQGQFNTPWGKYSRPSEIRLSVIRKDLRDASSILCGRVCLETSDFQPILERAKKGDFVYLDPPYVPLTKTANFTGYRPGGFRIDDLVRLRAACDRLTKRGVLWMLSNSDTKLTRAVFPAQAGFNVQIVSAPRAVAAKGSSRKAVKELVIRNYS